MPDHLPNFDSLWDYSRPDLTEQKFRALLPGAEKSGDTSYLLQLQTQIARCQGLQDNFSAAHTTLDAVESRLTDDLILPKIRCLLERGRVLNSSNHPDQARPLFLAALDSALAAREFGYAIDAAHMIAIVESDPVLQIDWNLKALSLIDQHPDQSRWLPSILNNLGEAHRARGHFDKALNCFQQRAQWFQARGKQPDIFTLKDIARMKRLLGDPQTALQIIEPIAMQLKSSNQSDGFISAEYGQCLHALGRAAEARSHLAEAYAILSKDPYMLRCEPDELQRIQKLT